MPTTIVSSPPYAIWDFVSPRGENEIARWAGDQKLTNGDRAKLDQKMDRLAQVDFQLAVGTKLLNGPIRKEIYKVKVHGQVMMRPLLCRGPVSKETEYTILKGAIEKDWKLIPATCLQDAVDNRNAVIGDPDKRRCAHAKFFRP
jgi:hypothetical protein